MNKYLYFILYYLIISLLSIHILKILFMLTAYLGKTMKNEMEKYLQYDKEYNMPSI